MLMIVFVSEFFYFRGSMPFHRSFQGDGEEFLLPIRITLKTRIYRKPSWIRCYHFNACVPCSNKSVSSAPSLLSSVFVLDIEAVGKILRRTDFSESSFARTSTETLFSASSRLTEPRLFKARPENLLHDLPLSYSKMGPFLP